MRLPGSRHPRVPPIRAPPAGVATESPVPRSPLPPSRPTSVAAPLRCVLPRRRTQIRGDLVPLRIPKGARPSPCQGPVAVPVQGRRRRPRARSPSPSPSNLRVRAAFAASSDEGRSQARSPASVQSRTSGPTDRRLNLHKNSAMASSQRPITTTVSTCTPETALGTHVFKIAGYGLHKGLGIGEFIRSTTFAVGGYDWCIRYYPDGADDEEGKEHFSVSLELLTKDAEVRAFYRFRLAFPLTLPPSSVFSSVKPVVFNSATTPIWGPRKFNKRSELETALAILRHDNITIACDVTVVKDSRVEDTTVQVQVPPSDLSDNLRKLLETAEEADVTFKVKGDVFPAHKIVLAMRSPVFKAQLYGPMRDKTRRNTITVKKMQLAVFTALLHFIYTDSLPSMDDLDADEHKEMLKHLLVAADRYAMERMKMMCEAMLCKSLDVETVATTLALADQRRCSQLKDACIQFITSSNRLDDIVASQGYGHLKRSCPAVIVDMWEKVTRSRRFF